MTLQNYFIKLKLRLSKSLQDLQFLMNCKNLELIPKFLQIKMKPYLKCPQAVKILKKSERLLLSSTIRDLRKTIAALELKLYYLHLELAISLDAYSFDMLFKKIYERLEIQHHNVQLKHFKKINILIDKKHSVIYGKNKHYTSLNENDNLNNYVNLTDIQLPPFIANFLNYGPKYSPKLPYNINKAVLDFENVITNVDATLQPSLRGHIVWTIKKILSQEKNLTSRLQNIVKTLNYLKNNLKFQVIVADKAPRFVVISKQDFQLKLNACISDLDVTIIDYDPTVNLLKDIDKLSMKYPNHKPDLQKKPLYPSIPTLSVKIKLHKPDKPLRPIVNRTNSPVYFLEKFLARMLQPLINNSDLITKSSLNVLDLLHAIKLAPSSKLYSLDVVALYPSIPLNIVHALILDKCKLNLNLHTHIDMINDILNIIFRANHFTIGGIVYVQNEGAPMGSSLAPVLGEIILQDIEDRIIRNSVLKPRLYIRYVDDSLLIWDYTEQNLNILIEKLNNLYNSIKFTKEKENNNTISFLDILIHRTHDNNLIWTEPYHKPTAPLAIIPANSYTYTKYKHNAIAPLIKRAFTHSTYHCSTIKELNYIKKTMIQHGYSMNLFHKLKLKIIKSLNDKNFQSISPQNNKYIGAVHFHRDLINIQRIFAKHNYKLAFKSNKLENLLKPHNIYSSPTAGVYMIPIKTDYGTKVYIGKTKRTLNKRISEHKYSLRSIYGNTALKQYLLSESNVVPLWDEAKIISRPNTDKKMYIQEKIEIIRFGEVSINEQQARDFAYLWQPILQLIKRNARS